MAEEARGKKGEWKMDRCGRNGARVVCVEPLAEQVIGYTSGMASQEEAEANALMWAASPELYDLLDELYYEYMDACRGAAIEESSIADDDLLERIVAALAKAGGEA